jgi:hypothetical protein
MEGRVKIKIILIVMILAFGFISCNITKEVSSKAFPEVYNHIEFWNGGTKIFEADDVSVRFVKSNVSGFLQSEYFLMFKVYKNGSEIITIMDSDSMSLVWN